MSGVTPQQIEKPAGRWFVSSVLVGIALLAVGILLRPWVSRERTTDAVSAPITLKGAEDEAASRAPAPPARTKREVLLEQLLALRAQSATRKIHRLLEDTARTDPALALELARAAARDELERNIFASGIARVWAARDPQATWQWLSTESGRWDVPCQTTVAAEVLEGVASSQPAQIAQWVEQRLSSGKRDDSASTDLSYEAVTALVNSGHLLLAQHALDQWSRGAARDQIGGATYALVAAASAKEAPQQTAAWVQTLPPSPGRAAGLLAVADSWAQLAPQPAIEWASTLGTADGREDAVKHVFDLWVVKDVEPAVRWLAAHEATPAADQMLFSWLMGSPLRTAAPAMALQWAQLINDPALRNDAMRQTFSAWARQDPRAADRFVSENQTLTAEQKTQLLAQTAGARTP
jgi:hypothetical protein